MTPRIDYYKAAPKVRDAMMAVELASRETSVPLTVRELVKVRVSQINGCGYCLHMHTQEARAAGVSQEQLDVVAAWRESPAFDDRERAALGWAEALTRVADGEPEDTDYAPLAAAFDEREQAELTLVITTINAWNRFAVGFRMVHPARS
ncbi:MAG: alkylhydroperoxidase [Stappia sp.]|uniref:carboxymuconolactone decarboxylase family protein n=1 Tax=Stappia sp. TaxID=1870903 RepID=UPI000C471813|nr:carboxymuconolactone decarboxylase family protein [Stappia sp.]MAA96757.1 alkylhydroperoxidase [Stappia sp.]MBM21876.1 alkylhydroperoxidase [Stappia sp.]